MTRRSSTGGRKPIRPASITQVGISEAGISKTGIGGMLSRALDANLRFTSLATQVAATALESAFSAASGLGAAAAADVTRLTPAAVRRGQPTASEQKPAPAIVLEGVAGSTAVGFFVVENSLPHEIAAAVEVSPLIAADGRRLDSVLRFSPGTISLAPGEQVVARVTAKISRRLVAGVRYEGQILVPGAGGAQIPIVLKRNAEAAAKAPGFNASRPRASRAKVSRAKAKTATKKRTKTGKKSGTKTGTKTGTKAAMKTGTKTAAKAGTKAGAGTGKRAATKKGTPARKPKRKPS
jgi:hypothetical protein